MRDGGLFKKLSKCRLYLVTGQDSSKGRSTPKVVEAALSGGVDIVQLREYSLTDSELLGTARQVRELTKRHGALFIVNNRPDLARLSGADGVHLGQDDLPPREARKILGAGKIVGISTHSLQQARKAVADGADYIGVGPVYPTPTKRGATVPVTLSYVRKAAKEGLPIPFFAIGGIKPGNLGDVLKAGASRVAVVTGLTAASDVEEVAREYREILGGFSHPGSRSNS